MECEVRFSMQATDEAARMSRRWHYWPAFVVKNFYGLGVVAVILFAGYSIVAESFTFQPDLLRAALGLLLMAGPIAAFWWLHKRNLRKAMELVDAINPLKLKFDSEGIHTFEKNGARTFTPWSSFDGFREGRLVILLRDGATKQYRMIPKQTVPESDAELLRSAIRAHLAEIG